MQAKLTVAIYLLLILLQITWLWLLPAPYGYQSEWMAAIFSLPLIFPLRGILRGSLRKAIIGAYLTLPHFMFAVAEGWARPAVRWMAVAQIFFIISYWILQIKRGQQRKAAKV